jgi:shikimate dehydrogenase
MTSPAIPTSEALQEIIAILASPAAGNPAEYLFERCLRGAGVDWQLFTCDVAPERIAAAIAGAAAMGFRGCLLSGPLREPALAMVATASPAATFARGVSLLERTADGFAGHMTEGRGTIEAVRAHCDPAGREVLVLGAGVTARGVALEMALAGSKRLLVAAPETARPEALVDDLALINAAPAEVIAWTNHLTVPEGIGIVVRATAEEVTLVGLRSETVVAEVAAEREPSPEAVAAGCCLVTGLEIRAAQAAIDFQSLTGIEPDVEMLREALDEYLS